MLDISTKNQPTIINERLLALNPQGYSRIQPTAALVGLHHQTLRRWWKANKFPKPIDVNGLPMFKNIDLLAWLDSHTLSYEED